MCVCVYSFLLGFFLGVHGSCAEDLFIGVSAQHRRVELKPNRMQDLSDCLECRWTEVQIGELILRCCCIFLS